MNVLYKKEKPDYTPRAHVVDGKLVLSYPGAVTPVVWQMDLAKAKASALEVQDNALKLKTPKGDSLDIAAFEDKDAAIEALMSASRALENAHGNIYAPAAGENRALIPYDQSPYAAYYGAQKKKKSWLPIILSLILIVGLIFILGSLSPRNSNIALTSASSSLGGGQQAASSASSAGVPVSADDFLRGR